MPASVHGRPIALTGLAIAAVVGLVLVSVFLLLRLWGMPPDVDRGRMAQAVVVPGPGLQSAPQLDLAQYRAEKQRLMDSTAWVDAQRGIARIPVTDAMALLAASAAAAPASAPRRAGSAP
jgi:hypothetical protein